MYLGDIPINHWGVLAAAIVYYVIGFIWYAPFAFGNKREADNRNLDGQNKQAFFRSKIGAYIGEFILSLVIAYVLTIMIQISQAEDIAEGVMVGIWTWVGFIATTHFSAVLWGRKTLEHFFIHVGFILLGLIAMAIVIINVGF